jgi:hypothetical protein
MRSLHETVAFVTPKVSRSELLLTTTSPKDEARLTSPSNFDTSTAEDLSSHHVMSEFLISEILNLFIYI